MINLLKKIRDIGNDLANPELFAKAVKGELTRAEIAYRLIPAFTAEIIRRYLKVKVEGEANLPREGGAIIVSNHSGYAGYDAVMLLNEITRAIGRRPSVMAHKLWFFGRPIAVISENMGFIRADFEAGLEALQAGKQLLLFPEGEAGNFKESDRRYRLQPFRRGFIRMALKTQVPIVPAMVIGAEETHINLSQIRFTKAIIGTVIPIPLNVIPLPVKWKIKFLPPIHLEGKLEDADNREKVAALARQVRRHMQRAMITELRARGQDLRGSQTRIELSEDDIPH